MNSLFSILLKNIILLGLIVISLIFVFTAYIGFKEVRIIFLIAGLLYILASCFEAYSLSLLHPDAKKFNYFTDGFIAKRFIKIISFTCIGVVMYYSQSIIKYMSFLCFLIAFTEIVVTVWRRLKNLCFVAFENDKLILASTKIDVIKAVQISKIETRHGITYFVNYNKNTITIRTDVMKQKEEFNKALDNWITTNNLTSKVVNG
jgi:hypothetical protein